MNEQRSELVAGFDLGTTYFKVGLYDRMGNRRGHGRRALKWDRPAAQRCELPVERFQRILKDTLDDAIETAACDRSDIKGISYGAQANTFLLLDEHLYYCRVIGI